MVAMISVRLWQIKIGKVKTNGEGASFWVKTYQAILITESKIINFLASIFFFCAQKAEQLEVKRRILVAIDKIFGTAREKISDIRKAVKGEPVASDPKETTSEFLKDISSHKENIQNSKAPIGQVEKITNE